MSPTKVSVIMPAYNQAEFIGEAIQSVLNQTYQHFELIIVDDMSTDNTSQVVKCFKDHRIQYILHDKNRMLPVARNTGIRASSGDIIALLDADDYYHPEKLEKHVAYLDSNPSIGVTYNPRFNLDYSRATISELVRPPVTVDLRDLVIGFPFAPSDMVIRRDWIFQVGLFDESFIHFSEDLDINCQLALAGCKFASVDRALNYRRYHSGRIIKNIPGRLDAALSALKKTFSDPRCPEDVLHLRETAFMYHYLIWSFIAFSQCETAVGQEYIQEAFERNRSMVLGMPCELIRFSVDYSIADENLNHARQLSQILLQLPKEMGQIREQYEWAVARGYLLKAIRAMIWGRTDDGRAYFAQASKLAAEMDKQIVDSLAYQLLSYENEFGSTAANEIIQKLSLYLAQFVGQEDMDRLLGNYSFNLAFQHYRTGNYKKVLGNVINAFFNQPQYIFNRGIWTILFFSVLKN